jgi:hypothetical protein
LVCCLLSFDVKADDYLSLSPSDKVYFKQIQKAVLTVDAKWLSQAFFNHPFIVYLPEGHIKLQSEGDLKKHFKAIFNTKLKEVVRNQSPDSLFKNWQGVMIGDGEIWFSEIGETNGNKLIWQDRIIAINVP